jgi:hypothetical protein
MNYFENIPEIYYKITDANFVAKIRNIFYKYELTLKGINLFEYYTITSVKRIDQISYDLYGTTDYWWIIAILNDIIDIIFDLPIQDTYLYKLAREYVKEREITDNKTYFTRFDKLTTEGFVLYEEEFERLQKVNESKRVLKVIKPSEIHKVLSMIRISI